MDTSPVQATKPQEYDFEAMQLQVGSRLQVITHRQERPAQQDSSLIGYVKNKYLIVKAPLENWAPVTLVEGEQLTVRVLSGGTVCSFASTVQRVFAPPLSYVHLAFPTSIQGTSRRSSTRFRVDIPARITASGPQAVAVECSLVNLSVSGALIESPQRLPPDDEIVTLQFVLVAPPANQEVTVQTRATIRYVNVAQPSSDQREIFTYGVQFVRLDPVHYALLQNMTYETLIAERQKTV